MERLGLWGDGTPFKTFETFLEGITKRGLGLLFNFSSTHCAFSCHDFTVFVQKSNVVQFTCFLYIYIGALEMLAMEMKAAGMYVSRGLSFREAEVFKLYCDTSLYCTIKLVRP